MHPAPLRIALLIPDWASLKGGLGAMLNLARGLLAEGCAVDWLVARHFPGDVPPAPADLPPGLRVFDLHIDRVASDIAPMMRYALEHAPGAVIATGHLPNYVALATRERLGAATPVIASVRARIAFELAPRPEFARRTAAQMAWLYPRAHAIVAVSSGVADELAQFAGLARDTITLIPNAADLAAIRGRAAAPAPHPWLAPGEPPVVLGAGRLVPQKDFPLLLNAFARMRQRREARLVILGEGPEREALTGLSVSLGIAESVLLPGHAGNPHAWMARAGVFALSSAWESFANVLVEALACGTPVVSTDCESGPRDILEDGRWGRLTPPGDPDAFALALLDALQQSPEPGVLRTAAERFDHPRVARAYLTLMSAAGG